ncbi:MAG TPA: ABC transporter ATP-binding protein [Anaerolineales bacterium]|nr:ABC transporter ATP-binding protein [Anaerolineales bacterium]
MKRDILRSKLKINSNQFRHLMRALGLVWNAAHRWTILWLALLVIQGLLPVASVYLTRALVDSLVIALRGDGSWNAFRSVLPFVIAMAVILLLTELLSYIAGYVRTVQSELVRDHISGLIHEKSVAADLSFYDMPEYYDHLYRAQYHALDRPLTLLESLGSVLQNGLTLVAMVAVLAPYGIWMPLSLLASSVPAFYIVLDHRLRFHEWRLKNTENERRAWYYNWALTDRETAAEIRIFGLGNHFQSLYQLVRSKLRNERRQLAWNQSIAEVLTATIALLITGLALGYMLWKAVLGSLTLGDLALFYQAFQRGQRLMGTLFENLGEIYSNSLFLNDLFEFLALEPKVNDPAQPVAVPAQLKEGIRFEGVTFHYPGSERVALSDFDITIPAGRIVAIVGANGAGKSTLVKLLCRFYDPEQGRVLLDGVDVRDVKLQELRRQITILFQEPVYYQNTFSENITLGDLSAAVDDKRVAYAANAAGADKTVAGLPNGYDTLLGKWFKGGTELSVGEWQRLALARAYWRQAPILVLDEPTSAMDPWAEHDWLQRFRELASHHTTLIITHRFTTAMYADIIHVMEHGHVIESGSHAELLAQNGRYAQSWREQMRVVDSTSGEVPPRIQMGIF